MKHLPQRLLLAGLFLILIALSSRFIATIYHTEIEG
jgi:hypothetical protein